VLKARNESARPPAQSLHKAQQSPCELMKEDRSPNRDHKAKPRAQQGFQAILAHPAQATKNYCAGRKSYKMLRPASQGAPWIP